MCGKLLKATAILPLCTASLLLAQGSPVKWPLPESTPKVGSPDVLVSAEWLAAALGDHQGVTVLDVRPVDARETGYLPGALDAADLGAALVNSGPGALRSRLGELGVTGGETVVIYGQGEDLERAGRAFWRLEECGHGAVKVLAGGLEAWSDEERSLSPQATPARPATFAAEVDEGSVSVTVDWLSDHFGQAGVELLDVRDAPRPEGSYASPPRYAAGHIPGSLPYDFTSDIEEHAGWPPPAMVRERLGKLGPRPGDVVNLFATFVIYGEDPADPQLGLGYLLLRLAGLDVRVFPAGFERWRKEGAVVREVSSAELAQLLRVANESLDVDQRPQQLIFIDLREPRDYSLLGHLPGAFNLPYRPAGFGDLFEAIVGHYWEGLSPTDAPVIFYCYGEDCVRSRKAATVVARRGHRNILIYRGGPFDWEAQGYPLFESPLDD